MITPSPTQGPFFNNTVKIGVGAPLSIIILIVSGFAFFFWRRIHLKHADQEQGGRADKRPLISVVKPRKLDVGIRADKRPHISVVKPIKLNVGIRFQPIGQDTTSEDNITGTHWALVFTPSDGAGWSFRVELVTDKDNVISFPARVFDTRVYAHPLATFTGYLDDILKLMQVHPIRGTSYSTTHNNCQHWVATLLVFMRAFSDSTPGRQYEITSAIRHNKVLEVLTPSGDSLYHTPNWWLRSGHLAAVGGGAAAVGAAAVAAEATVMLPASGIAGWLGLTVATPTFMALVATAAMPFTVGAAAAVGGTYVFNIYLWRKNTTFDDPRKRGCLTNGKSLSRQEKGESMGSVGGSLSGFSEFGGLSSGALLGSYVGINVGAVSAAFSPSAAAVFAPSAAGAIAHKVNQFY